MRSTESAGSKSTQILVLGASNVRRGWRPLLQVANDRLSDRFDAHLVMGHGRSLGSPTSFFGTRFTPLLRSVAWDYLERRRKIDAPPVKVFITDIGNDVLYGESAQQIVAWVEESVQRASALADHVVVTRLPLFSIEQMTKWRYLVARTLIWPSSQVSYSQAVTAVREIDAAIADCNRPPHVRVVSPDRSWYGLDPVHVRRRSLRDAWATYLESWSNDAGASSSMHDRSAIKIARRLPRPIRNMEQTSSRAMQIGQVSTVRFYVG